MGDGIFLLIPILFPIVAGLVVFAINHRIARQIYVGTVLVLNAIAVFFNLVPDRNQQFYVVEV